MTTHDDDILDFDFFDEGATREAPAREETSRRPSGEGPRGPRLRSGGLTPLLRLIGLIAFAILLVVLVVVWAQGCASDRQRGAYDDYMSDLRPIATDSGQIGQELAELLTTPGLKQDELETSLTGLIERQQLDVTRAGDLDPPGPVTPESEYANDSLEMRVIGLQGMLNVFKSTKASKDATAAGQLLSEQGLRLTSSDVVWDDFFRKPAELVLEDARHRRRLRPRFQLRRERRALQRPLDERDLAANPRCLDGRHPDGRPRLEPGLRPGTAERPDAVAHH